ncbi:transcription factor Adf-1-like [Frankliniella occidentalis]|uniref:Transcription factor Adf-1-like n=1 Tax=Frankliniella occidentalis TaxID=133901 RepID=A0A9C6WRE0_FRAOC|nr:transcription factor Adf-1-like [Frankliniella occidentalis]
MAKKEIDIRLAQAVEKYPILWDCGDDLYKRTDLKPEAWTKVVELVGPPATEEWAVKRWKSMKDTFHDNHRRVRESKRSGVSTDEIVKPTWYLYKYLTYLIKTCAQAISSSNLT